MPSLRAGTTVPPITAADAATRIRSAAETFARTNQSTRRPTRPLEGLSVLVNDDSAVFREGLDHLLREYGASNVAVVESVDELLAVVAETTPDVVIVDAAQPPLFATEGLVAALTVRALHPGIPVLVLSVDVQVEAELALTLIQADPRGVGYLGRARLDGRDDLTSAITRMLAGGTALDADLIEVMVARTRRRDAIERLSPRERQILELVARGLSNSGIATELFISPKTVEGVIASTFAKLGIDGAPTTNRRVLAAIAFLSGSPT